MNLRIITQNQPADSKIGFPLKIDFRADWTHESNSTAWELNTEQICLLRSKRSISFSDFFYFENLGTFFQNPLVFKAVNKLGNSVFIQEDYSKVESQSPAVVIGGSPWSICLS